MPMSEKRIPFSQARQNLTSIIDDVEKSGRSVTVMRRGKPVAVIVDHGTYQQFIETAKQSKWLLKGSMLVTSGPKLDNALAEAKASRIRTRKKSAAEFTKLS